MSGWLPVGSRLDVGCLNKALGRRRGKESKHSGGSAARSRAAQPPRRMRWAERLAAGWIPVGRGLAK